ncbi:unnamed protein product [Sphagnum troendelagicum]|uniref:F-box domain-containing protein n=1 Tax=Sphagnum troendelagicum TaxID=128251 RepID=A0ABP0UBW8_9BRYO
MQSSPSTSTPAAAGVIQPVSCTYLMDEVVWGKLPETDLELIFARLPLKDIVRLQALNTRWKSLIRSSYFQQRLEQVSQQLGATRFGLLTQVIKGPRSLCWDFHIFDTPAGEWNHFSLSGPPDTISKGIFPIATAGGLVCMSNVYGERIFVVNPVTNACRKLPQDLSGNMSGWTKCRFLTMALMEETTDNHHHHHHQTRKWQYTLTLALSQKPWPEGSNLTSLLCEKQVNVSHFHFAVYDSATNCWSKRDNPNDPNLLRNKIFRLFPSGAAVMASTDVLGNQVFQLIPRPLDVTSKPDWMETAPNDSDSRALAYGVRLSWFPQSVDVYKLQSAGQLEWKMVASVPAKSGTQLLRECKCFMVRNDKQLIIVKCHANKQVIYNEFPVSMCDLTTCTWQDLPSIFPSLSGTLRSDSKTTKEINMAGLAGCTFEIKFDAVP